MRHLVLPQSTAQQACAALLEDEHADVEAFLEWVGTGIELPTQSIEDLAAELREEHDTYLAGPRAKDKDHFEGIVAARLHSVLEELEVDMTVLDEPGFWGYLSVQYFWWFVTWRQWSTFESRDFGKYRRYVDGTHATECVLLRAYLRGALAHRPNDEDPYALAYGIPDSTDFWRSHVLRVQTGSSPEITQAFASEQMRERMNTDELRTYARRLNRMWTNVVLHTYDETEAAEVVLDLR